MFTILIIWLLMSWFEANSDYHEACEDLRELKVTVKPTLLAKNKILS